MKKRIFLLVAVILLALFTVACSDDPVTPPEEEVKGPDCFFFEENAPLANIEQYDGEIVDSNEKFNAVALRTEEMSATLGLKTTIRVYDLKTGAAVYNSYDSLNADDLVNYDLSLEYYPVIELRKTVRTIDDEGEEVFETIYDYALVQPENQNSMSLETAVEDRIRFTVIENMYVFEIEDTIYWVNKDYEIVREVKANVSDSYTSLENLANYFGIDAEYNGYLYAWEFTEINRAIYVYDRNGACITQYNFPTGAVSLSNVEYNDSIINPRIFVLNNGNIFVQYCKLAEDDATAWDITYTGMHLDVETVIINYVTGETSPVDCNYIVYDLESAYARLNNEYYSTFAFELAQGYENQAYIVEYANGYLSDKLYYTVLDNSANVKYTLKNEQLAKLGPIMGSSSNVPGYAIDIDSIGPDGYIATVWENGSFVNNKYDYDGNKIGTVSANCNEIVGNLMVTQLGVYDLTTGEIKYNFEDNGFVPNEAKGLDEITFVANGSIYIARYNYATGGTEIHALNTADWTTSLLIDGVDVEFFDGGEGYIISYNSETDVSTLYNCKNEIILKVRGHMDLYASDDVIYATVVVGNDHLVYAINEKTAQK